MNASNDTSFHTRQSNLTCFRILFSVKHDRLSRSVSLQHNKVLGGKNANPNAKYAVAASAASFGVAALVVISYLIPTVSHFCVGTRIEGILIFILNIFWGATVAVVTNATSGLSVSADGVNTVQNGNLYYFSWAGFVTAIILMVSYLRERYGVDVVGQVQNRATRLSLWAGMLASALVVMGASSRILGTTCKASSTSTGVDNTILCNRTKFGVALGTIGVVFAIGVIAVKMCSQVAPLMTEMGIAMSLAIMNAFGVAYITSPAGPGSAIGNLYYFAWLSFVCSALLTADCYNQYSGANTEQQPKQETEVEVVQNLDDNI